MTMTEGVIAADGFVVALVALAVIAVVLACAAVGGADG
jgi:hypothetical protein